MPLKDERFKQAVAQFAQENELEKVLVETVPGRCWVYSPDGKLEAEGVPTWKIEPKLDARYAVCFKTEGTPDGYWDCVVYEGDAVIEETLMEAV